MEMFLTNFPLARSRDRDHSWGNISPSVLALLAAWSETNKQFRLQTSDWRLNILTRSIVGNREKSGLLKKRCGGGRHPIFKVFFSCLLKN